ncbi:MAG: PAS domain S-box protein [Bacteroidota bacterium]
MNPSTYQEIKDLFDNYIDMYSSRNDHLTDLFSSDFSGFAGGGNTLVKDREEWIAVTRQDFAQVKEKIDIQILDLAIQSLAENVAVATSFFTIKLPMQDEYFSRETARLVLIFHKELDHWKIAHSSISIPYGLVREGEIYPVKSVEDRNRLLEKIIAEKSSELEKIHLALKESEKLYRSIIKASPENITITDMEGRILLVSPAGVEMFGIKDPDEYLGHTLTDFLIPEDRERSLSRMAERMRGASIGISEYKALRADGSTFDIEVNSDFIRDDDGRPTRMVVVIRDITERKRTEKTLRENEERFRLLTNNVPDVIYSLDGEGNVVTINSMAIERYGYTEEESKGNPFMGFIHPEDRDIVVGSLIKAIQDQRKQTKGLQFRIVAKDGTIHWCELNSNARFDDDHRYLGEDGVLRDITDRKVTEQALRESENRYRTLAEASPDSIYVIGLDDRVLYVNTIGAKQFGRSPGSIIGGKRSELFPKTIAEQQQVSIQKVLTTGLSVSNEMPIQFGDRQAWLSNWLVPMRDGNGEIVAVMGIGRDITESKKSEQALRQAQKLESIGTLAGGIAHDFNNLMNAVLGQSALALQKLSKENPAAANIQKAIKASERVADLTKQLLAYSGRGKFVIDEIDLNMLVKENVQILGVSIPKTAKLLYELASPSLKFRGDISQIQQVIMNLIINAGEAMDPNPGTIIVRTGMIEIEQQNNEYSKYTTAPLAPGSYVMLQVKDSGCGISEETLTRIFDPFFTTKFTGRGLGLAAVLGIIKGHKGGLRIESEVGKGTLFEIIFPLVAASQTNEVPEKKVVSVDGSGITILAIDDEAAVIELLEDVLCEINFTLISALDPLEGIEIYRRDHQKISLVVLDYSMPNMDGKATFEELLKINKDVKVLLCSGYSEEETLSVFGADRPTGYFQKPYKPDAFVQKVAEIIL